MAENSLLFNLLSGMTPEARFEYVIQNEYRISMTDFALLLIKFPDDNFLIDHISEMVRQMRVLTENKRVDCTKDIEEFSKTVKSFLVEKDKEKEDLKSNEF